MRPKAEESQLFLAIFGILRFAQNDEIDETRKSYYVFNLKKNQNSLGIKLMAKERFKLICSSYLLLIKNNKILLGKRQNTGYMDGFWHLPAGHKEEGETAIECLIREIAEEIGIELNQKNIKFVHIMCRKENDERVDLFFEVKKYKNKIRNMEPEKCEELKWFDLNNLPENTVPYARHAIECYKQNIFFSEFGWNKQQKQ